jgi:DNA (cytosine-5)-methyltransferase 1
VEPIIVHSTHRGKRPAHTTKAPLPTVTGAHRGEMALVEPVIVQTDQTGSNGACTQSIHAPIKTVVGKQNMGLVQPFILPKEGYYRGNTPKSVDQPVTTITAEERMTLVEPFVIKYYGTGVAKDLRQPLDTVTTKDRFLLVQPKTGEILAELDIRFRMLQPHELSAAHSFPKSYVFTGNKGDQVKQIGNSVTVLLAKAHARSIFSGMLHEQIK